MLLEKQRVLALECRVLLHPELLARFRNTTSANAQAAFADFLAPARQHEGMNVQRAGDVLDQNALESR